MKLIDKKLLSGSTRADNKKDIICRGFKLGIKKDSKIKGRIHSIGTLKFKNIIFNDLVKHLEYLDNKISLTEISIDDLKSFIDIKISNNVSSRYLVNILSTISSSFQYLQSRGYYVSITKTEFANIREYCKSNGTINIKKNRAIKLNSMSNISNEQVTIMANIQIETGIRLNELYQIRCEQIYYDGSKYFLKEKLLQSKGGKKIVRKTLTNKSAKALLILLNICNNKFSISKTTYNKYLKAATGETSHALRYNYVQNLNRELNTQGIDFHTKKKRLAQETGHNREDSINGYSEY